MNSLKHHFPIFENNSDLIYLDSTASAQKPSYVIDALKKYLETSYSNIHRGLYDISYTSEQLYFESKKKVAVFLNADDYREVVYTYNSNYALNLLSQTLRYNKVLQKWDTVLLSILEHHSNIVPWLILKEEIGIEIDFVGIDEKYQLDMQDFARKYNSSVKVISLTQVSNVTGEIFNLEKIGKLKRKDTIFIVDASQSFPHFSVDVKQLGCDFLFFTAHKVMADSWLGVLWWKKEILEQLKPIFCWGGAINQVKEQSFQPGALPYRFEPGTPNISGALSLLKALEYIEMIGWYPTIESIERELCEYTLWEFAKRPYMTLIGNTDISSRVGVFSFIIDGVHAIDIADVMAENNIAIRAGQHCSEPFMDFLWIHGSARMSLYMYNTFDDIKRFFQVLDDNFS